ncbi:MAG: GNAT family N-acetyltransferase [Lachnospiraceae bacterium]|nr:GNAT family N-acetyltransferase [Lachnospiraceae bacterium]
MFENYFTEERWDAFFIKEEGGGKILGFAMVNTYVQKCSFGHSIAEFMVLPKFRRNKIGKKAAAMCFEKYPGNWEVSPSFGSGQAYLFWKNVIDEYTDKKNTYEDGIFCF